MNVGSIARFEATRDERTVLTQMSQLLSSARSSEVLESVFRQPIGEFANVTPALYGVFCQALDVLASGEQVSVAATNAELTTGEAAKFLEISRPYVVKLLEEGAFPYTTVGTHRRIRYDHLIAFRQAREARQLAARRLIDLYAAEAIESTPVDEIVWNVSALEI